LLPFIVAVVACAVNVALPVTVLGTGSGLLKLPFFTDTGCPPIFIPTPFFMWFLPHDSKKLTAEIPANKLPAPKPVFFINFLRFIIINFLVIAWIADEFIYPVFHPFP
jgi:hypothetical protein